MKRFLERQNSIIVLLLGIIIIKIGVSCSENQYEKAVIGNYRVFKSDPIDSIASSELPILSLYSNKEFLLKVKEAKIVGKWKAFDSGEHIIIQFIFSSTNISDATVGGEELNIINIYNSRDFKCPKLKSFSFIKVYDLK